jgi:hypothetical protein
MEIQFTNTTDLNIQDAQRKPYRAAYGLPDWYKKTPSYTNKFQKKHVDENNDTKSTIKRCMPVFDAITAGYIIPTVVDVFVSRKDGEPYYSWPSFNALEFHPIEQAALHPKNNGFPFPKWVNPWSINTPKGYSSLFVSPLHGDDTHFSILPGLVDTDVYHVPVNFPFVLNDPDFEGLIPAGTPMVQVIPIKRESWNLKFKSIQETRYIDHEFKRLRSVWFDAYKRMFRQPKEYN